MAEEILFDGVIGDNIVLKGDVIVADEASAVLGSIISPYMTSILEARGSH